MILDIGQESDQVRLLSNRELLQKRKKYFDVLTTEGRCGILQVARRVRIVMSIFAQLYKEPSHLEFVAPYE